MMVWSHFEKGLLKSLNTPEKIQNYLDDLRYNAEGGIASARFVIQKQSAHCLEGAFLASAALDFHGHKPLVVSLVGHDDDHHAIVVYKGKHGWGSMSKSNTTLLRGRDPVYRSIRELVMSYFDFYFNIDGFKSLYAYSNPINLNQFRKWDWRIGEDDLNDLGIAITNKTHFEIISTRELRRLPKAKKFLHDACFLGADMNGVFHP